MTTININLTFKQYQFSRVKARSGKSAIAYTNRDWVGKEVLIIPMPLTVTDRWIETQKTDETYNITIKSDMILKKVIKKGANIGIVYLPSSLIGIDCLIIESPKLTNF